MRTPVTERTLSVTTYNVLADAYVRPEYYPRVPRELLLRGARTEALARRILGLDTDVLCLQEVEPGPFERLSAALAAYTAWFSPKTGRAEGCATFVRTARVESAEFCEHRYGDASGHLALVTRLRCDGLRLAVANTHAKWSPRGTPNAEHFGWRQLTELEEARSILVPEADAWIVCGDLNFESDEEIVAELGRRGLRYAHVGTSGRTCIANGRAKLIDYLFYTEPLVAEPSAPEPLRDDSILPSASEPSDHLPLRADFRWAPG